ncbi:MAG: protein-methionine-sulfoxide reductase catalytic subunit MsrP [Marinobacter sp.]|nr:protein-methionine-sulfoxide reductase catalytic subunit MsrP [Marinobacter sp.]
MLIRNKPSWHISHAEVTPEPVYLARRQFMAGTLATATALMLPASLLAEEKGLRSLSAAPNPDYSTAETKTPFSDVTRYNNFYEFGTGKGDPARYAHEMQVEPWFVSVEGECARPGRYNLADLINEAALEERVYRLRCVEAWSMVIPWVGVPLASLIEKFEPAPSARYVYFETLHDPAQMRGQRGRFSTIEWPYREGLRMDEAVHPLTFVAVGLYGRVLPNQNGAPLRLVVPWKYGFKSIKSIVRIRFQAERPKTTWEQMAPHEYGFYANVNPHVDHPRWSQRRERRLPSGLLSPNWMDTRLFNGYEAEVAHLYAGMNLAEHY